MSTKRKRGSNYTLQETAKLLELVEQYRTAIEEKRTNAVYLRQKNDAWNKICHAYNAVATSGVRTVAQLRVLYDNKKQKARKSAIHNKNEYNNTDVDMSSPYISETDLKVEIVHETSDKEEGSEPGGGSWCPTDTESDQKNLELRDQDPLQNEFNNSTTSFQATIPRRPPKQKNKNGDMNFKLLYFKRKCQNANLERRRLYQEIHLRQKEHNMLVKEHQIRLQYMEEEHIMKMTGQRTA